MLISWKSIRIKINLVNGVAGNIFKSKSKYKNTRVFLQAETEIKNN